MKTLGDYTLNELRKICQHYTDRCSVCPLYCHNKNFPGSPHPACSARDIGWDEPPRWWDKKMLERQVDTE